MRSPAWRRACWLVGLAVLGGVLWRAGAGPFLAGVRALDLPTLAVGTALAVPITCACAWRWHLVAKGLGVTVAPTSAVAACYRAQLLNTVLPGGVLGDVHRGVHHGRLAGDTGRGLRAVAWERTAGQVVQAVVAVVVIAALPSPLRVAWPWVVGATLVVLVIIALVALGPAGAGGESWTGRVLRGVRHDLRHGVLARASWPGVVLASLVTLTGHVATYLLAARAVGVTASTATLVPLALLVLLAAGLPTNVAGWGPREGVAAWTFGAAGLGAEQGVATAVAYGAIVAVANLPGVVVLVTGAARGNVRTDPAARRSLRATAAGGPAHG